MGGWRIHVVVASLVAGCAVAPIDHVETMVEPKRPVDEGPAPVVWVHPMIPADVIAAMTRDGIYVTECRFENLVDSTGAVISTRVLRSSGYAGADSAVVAAARRFKYKRGLRGDLRRTSTARATVRFDAGSRRADPARERR